MVCFAFIAGVDVPSNTYRRDPPKERAYDAIAWFENW